MNLLDRIRAFFSNRPQVGAPSSGTLMERGDGEIAGHRDELSDSARRADFGAPNQSLTESVRPPME